MTNTYDITSSNVAANPLFAKLRSRFMCQDNCTIGEIMLRKAENDGYKCTANVTSGVRSKSNFSRTSEYYITRGNAISTDEIITKTQKTQRNHGGFAALFALCLVCAIMLTALVLNRVSYVKNNLDNNYQISAQLDK